MQPLYFGPPLTSHRQRADSRCGSSLAEACTAKEVWDLDHLIKPTLDAMEGIFGLRPWRGPTQAVDDDRTGAQPDLSPRTSFRLTEQLQTTPCSSIGNRLKEARRDPYACCETESTDSGGWQLLDGFISTRLVKRSADQFSTYFGGVTARVRSRAGVKRTTRPG